MASGVPTFKFNNGVTAPAVGIGCWAGLDQTEREKSKDWILTALKNGYRRIDTAYVYGTEKAVGQAIKESGIPREEIFITTKLPWHHCGMEEESIQRSLDNLGTDYVDLYLVHWPQCVVNRNDESFPRDADGKIMVRDDYHFTQVWAAMEKILASGKARAIGVSNFSIKNLEILLKNAKVVPADNQVELHPYLVQEDLVQYCQSRGIAVTAYTPTGYATVRNDPVIVELAKKYNTTPAQVILAWHVARGIHVVPCSKNPEHQKENITLPTLDAEDVKRISALDKNQRLCNGPDEKGLVNGWTLEQLGW